MPRKKRNYRKEYDSYHGTAKKGDPREVDHKKPLSKGGGNGRKNLRAVSRKVNRKKGNKTRK